MNLTPATGLSIGQHNIEVYTFNPVSSTGSGDQVTTNDTLSKGFGIAGIIAAPLSEGFESAIFPPVGWVNVNADADTTWVRTGTGNNSTASAFVNILNIFLQEGSMNSIRHS